MDIVIVETHIHDVESASKEKYGIKVLKVFIVQHAHVYYLFRTSCRHYSWRFMLQS